MKEQGLAPISHLSNKRGYTSGYGKAFEIFSALKSLYQDQIGIPLRGHPKGLRDPEKDGMSV
jgi:hypothetical protein